MPPVSDENGMHYLGVAPVSYGAGGEAIIEREHLRFAPEFGGTMSFAGNPEGILNTDGDFDDADILSFGESEGWTYYDSMGRRPPKPCKPSKAKPFIGGLVRQKNASTVRVYVLAPSKRAAKGAARTVIALARKHAKGAKKDAAILANKNKRHMKVKGPVCAVPSPGPLPHMPFLPPPLVPLFAFYVDVPVRKSKQKAASKKATVKTLALDSMVNERKGAPRVTAMLQAGLKAARSTPGGIPKGLHPVHSYKQLSAEQEWAEDEGIDQNLPVEGLTWPGGGGDSYEPSDDTWAEQGVDQARYDSAVAQLLADEFGDNPYGVSDTNWDGPPVQLPALYEEEQLWNSAFGGIPSMEDPLAESLGEDENGIPSMADPMAESLGWLVEENVAAYEVLGGDVYDEGSGILYDGYQDERPMSVAQLHNLPDPADVVGDIPSMDDVYEESLGADPYDKYFGAACGC